MNGWTYEADLPAGTTIEAARQSLARMWGATGDPDPEVLHTTKVDIRVEALLPDDEHDLAIDFFGATDDVTRLAAVLPRLFERVSEPVWS